eukprot:symbB.v1.2.014457.t1/scaffold1056.1/size140729/6
MVRPREGNFSTAGPVGPVYPGERPSSEAHRDSLTSAQDFAEELQAFLSQDQAFQQSDVSFCSEPAIACIAMHRAGKPVMGRKDSDRGAVLSSILRREASSHGLAMDEDGWVKVSDLISSDTVQLLMCALPFYQTGFNRETLLILIEQSNAQKPRYEVRNMEDVEMVRAIDKRNPKKLVNKHPYSNDEFTGLVESKISLTVVGLGGETLCQTRISPNSTVMNVRCAIAEEAGIPIQSQQLVHGCTKLSDPSAKLVVDTQEETVEITCVRSSVEPQDLCTWCGGVLGVPVESLCPCKKLYCITCIRDMIGLNGESAKSRTCPICHHVLSRSKAAAHSYAKRFDLIQYLDATYGAVECPRGCGSSYLRQFASGHMDVCLHTKKKCPLCFQFYTGSRREHEVHCRLREDHEVHHQLRLLGYFGVHIAFMLNEGREQNSLYQSFKDELAQDPRNSFATKAPYLSLQIYSHTSLKFPAVRPLSLYTLPVVYSGANSTMVLLNRRPVHFWNRRLLLNSFAFLNGFDLRFQEVKDLKDPSFSNWLSHRAGLYFPYDWLQTMGFYDWINMAFPTFVPDTPMYAFTMMGTNNRAWTATIFTPP